METRFGSSRFDALASKADGLSGIAPTTDAVPLGSGTPNDSDVLVFDACHVGVILRAVVAVELVVAAAVMFTTDSIRAWLSTVALVTGAALPATLLWLIAACAFKRVLHRLALVWQWTAGVGAGAVCGLYGCALLYWMGIVTSPHWLASGAAAALLAAGIVGFLVLRSKQRAPAAAAARLSELQARIRPHFLFNTLNSAIALVRQDPSKAEAMLEDLSELFRSALADQGESVTLEQELDMAQRYLAIEQVRFGPRLRLTWDIDPRSLHARLPPLILQPLVENAVLHGVEPSASGAEIKISTQRRGSTVVIKITNTAPGGQGQAGNGLALKNAQERLALLHDVQCSFRCTWEGGVYQVRMEVPA